MSTDAFLSMFAARDAHEPADPMKAAQGSMRAALPRRFYATATASLVDGRHQLLLDGKPARTPGRKPLAVEGEGLGAALAAEWNAIGTVLDPALMPLTRLVNSAIDGVAERADEVRAEIVRYAGSDLICYRADGPEALVARQSAHWDPLVAWAKNALGARLTLAAGVIHVPQSDDAMACVAAAVHRVEGAVRLAGLSAVTTLTGSAIIALAVAARAIEAEAAWAAGALDELYQAEVWGVDEEAEQRQIARRREFDAACLALGAPFSH
jgi:chaperone required for assembly of F1-ATPase